MEKEKNLEEKMREDLEKMMSLGSLKYELEEKISEITEEMKELNKKYNKNKRALRRAKKIK